MRKKRSTYFDWIFNPSLSPGYELMELESEINGLDDGFTEDICEEFSVQFIEIRKKTILNHF